MKTAVPKMFIIKCFSINLFLLLTWLGKISSTIIDNISTISFFLSYFKESDILRPPSNCFYCAVQKQTNKEKKMKKRVKVNVNFLFIIKEI